VTLNSPASFERKNDSRPEDDDLTSLSY